MTPAGAVISGDWKLVEFFEDGRLELYNVREDIGETRNVASAQPEKVKELQAKLVAWRKETNAPMPTAHRAGEKPAGIKARKGSDDD